MSTAQDEKKLEKEVHRVKNEVKSLKKQLQNVQDNNDAQEEVQRMKKELEKKDKEILSYKESNEQTRREFEQVEKSYE